MERGARPMFGRQLVLVSGASQDLRGDAANSVLKAITPDPREVILHLQRVCENIEVLEGM